MILGQDFNFTCVTYGKGIWVTWLKNGKAVRNNQTDTQAIKGTADSTYHRKVLMIKKTTKADEGNYTCKVTTSLQPGFSNNVTAKLRVKGNDICSVRLFLSFSFNLFFVLIILLHCKILFKQLSNYFPNWTAH